MNQYSLTFPEYLDSYEVETEAKGYLVNVKVSAGKEIFDLTVYDPVRLTQEISEEVSAVGYFAFANVLVVPTVTKTEISRAVETLAKVGFASLIPTLQK